MIHKKNKEIILKIILMLVVIFYYIVGISEKTSVIMATVILIILVTIILNLEKMLVELKNKNGGILYAIYFSIYFALRWNPMKRTSITAFDRVIGGCTKVGIDVSKRVHNFYFWFMGAAIIFALVYLGANYFKRLDNCKKYQIIINKIDELLVVANVALLFRIICFFKNEESGLKIFTFSLDFLTLSLLVAIFYVVFDFKKNIEHLDFVKLVITAWEFSFLLSVLVLSNWESSKFFLIEIIATIICMFLVKFMSIKWNCCRSRQIMNFFVVLGSFTLFGTSFYIELIAILNQHKLFIDHLRLFYLIAGILFIGVVALIFKALRIKYIVDWKKWTYPIIILGVTCLYSQIPISGTYTVDMFEGANYSVLISDYLNYGKIPIVEHYGGHMLLNVLEGIIYGKLNGDYIGAVVSPYQNYIVVIIALLFYFILKKIWNRDIAFVVVLFIPFYNSTGANCVGVAYWGIGILTCLLALRFIRKPSYLWAFFLWGTIVWCALVRLDIGFSFALAVLATFLVILIVKKEKQLFKYLSLMLTLWIGIGVSVWGLICICKGINPVNRLIEFLEINFSNQNWAYTTIGDVNKFSFVFVYILIPFTIAMCLVYLVGYMLKYKEINNREVLLLILGFSYFFNFHRGLVRHSLNEGLALFNWTAFFFLALFFMSITNKKKVFLPIFSALVICNSLISSDESLDFYSLTDTAIEKTGTYTNDWKLGTYWESVKKNREVISRVKMSDDMTTIIEDYSDVINQLLTKKETFIDFTNKSFLYSALDRLDPVYISQSPGQLSGEDGQKKFVDEMKGVPLILMPCGDSDSFEISLDGIANNYRYYKISERIFQDYTPLCKVKEKYTIWCLKSRYKEMVSKINTMESKEIDIKEKIVQNDFELMHDAVNIIDKKNKIILKSEEDAKICGIEHLFDYTEFEGKNSNISIDYNASGVDDNSTIDMYYTTEENEEFSEEKVQREKITSNGGRIYFRIPITKYTKIRVDIPDYSEVCINSFKINSSICQKIQYGYDDPFGTQNNSELYTQSHNYDLGCIPLVWAELDKKNSSKNYVLTIATNEDGTFRFESSEKVSRDIGNYLKIKANSLDDEMENAQVRLGTFVNGEFKVKYIYNFTVDSGEHEYMFRISSDYYWYNSEIDACQIDGNANIIDVDILEGD